MEHENNHQKERSTKVVFTWFWRWFLNNKIVTALLISLLLFLNIFVFSKISYVFSPIAGFLEIVGLPVIMAGILYYLFNPLIDWLEAKKIPRLAGIAMVFVVISGLIVWGATTLIPILQAQTLSFLRNWPDYWANIILQVDTLARSDALSQVQTLFSDINQNLINAISEQANSVLDTTVAGIGSVVGAVTNIVIAVITMPFILFYLLKDGHNLPYHLMKFLPVKMRKSTYTVLTEINRQISQYIRGQLIVAFFVAFMFWAGFSLIGLEYAVTLSVLAGFLNMIPYLGSFLATIPAVILALVDSPGMLIRVLIVFIIEQTIEGRVIQPQILGSNLEIHPITIIMVLLTAGNLFGIPGVIFGIPGYAILKVVFTHIFEWYKKISGLYEYDYNPAPEPDIPIEKRKKGKFKGKKG